MNKAPAYQMYAGDWIKSRNVRMFTDYQRGWYIQLLNEAWISDPQCMLPNDRKTLQLLAGISPEIQALPDFNERWNLVERMFKVEGEYVYNERQLLEFTQQKLRSEKAKKAGYKSAKVREEKRKELQNIKRQHFTEANGRSLQAELNVNSVPTLHTSSSSSSSDFLTPLSHASRDDVFLWWNAIAEKNNRPKIDKMTETRLRKFRIREKEGLWDRRNEIESAIENMAEWAKQKKWLNFDWIMKNSDNWDKLVNGAYEKEKNTSTHPTDDLSDLDNFDPIKAAQ